VVGRRGGSANQEMSFHTPQEKGSFRKRSWAKKDTERKWRLRGKNAREVKKKGSMEGKEPSPTERVKTGKGLPRVVGEGREKKQWC